MKGLTALRNGQSRTCWFRLLRTGNCELASQPMMVGPGTCVMKDSNVSPKVLHGMEQGKNWLTGALKLQFIQQSGGFVVVPEAEGAFKELAGSASKHWTVHDMLNRPNQLRKENSTSWTASEISSSLDSREIMKMRSLHGGALYQKERKG
jgi:hypothetical protein